MTPDAALTLEPLGGGVFDGFFIEYDMTDYPILAYPKREVVRVGDTLRRRIPEDRAAEALHAFRVAYDWRNSHAYPMRKIRRELGGRVKKLHIEGGITAARMKRMSSIRKKLARLSINLTQIQDLGGCRAILPSIENASAVIEAYRAGASIHVLRNESDYIEHPKDDGYRSLHLVLAFQGQDEELGYDGRRVEVQIRTELQHSWATAVEAVGLFRGEDLKAGEGNGEWLRLFALMGSEFAEIEKSPLVPGTPASALRRKELRHLNHKLKAVDTLENLSQSFRAAESFLRVPYARYFVLRYDKTAGIVSVKTLAGAVWAENQSRDEQSPDDVLVEVDKVENLRQAYPNYFGDVRVFLSHLKTAALGYDVSFLQAWGRHAS